jgi:protein-disulfide isomerase
LINLSIKYVCISLFLFIYDPCFAKENILNSADFDTAVRNFLMKNPEVIFEAIEQFEKNQFEKNQSVEKHLIQKYEESLFNDNFSFKGGNKEGSITIVEFIDYRCGYCKKAHNEIYELLITNNDLRYIIKEFPILGPESVLASKAAIHIFLTQGDKMYKKFNDKIFTYNGPITIKKLNNIIESIDGIPIDVESITNNQKIESILGNNRILANELKIQGTPTFIINDTIIRGYKPKSVLQKIINEQKQLL